MRIDDGLFLVNGGDITFIVHRNAEYAMADFIEEATNQGVSVVFIDDAPLEPHGHPEDERLSLFDQSRTSSDARRAILLHGNVSEKLRILARMAALTGEKDVAIDISPRLEGLCIEDICVYDMPCANSLAEVEEEGCRIDIGVQLDTGITGNVPYLKTFARHALIRGPPMDTFLF